MRPRLGTPTSDHSASAIRRPWIAPALAVLPPLTALTLQSSAPIDGGYNGGGIIITLLNGRSPSRLG